MTIDLTELQRQAKVYEPVLQTLPFTTLTEPMTKLGITLVDVQSKNVIVSFERRGGLSRPYASGSPDGDFNAGEIGRAKERELSVEKCILPLVDHVDNYKDLQLLPGQTPADNQSKKHPLERLILDQVVITEAEDIIDAMFHSKRDVADVSPLGMFDGFFTKIATEVAAGDISVAKGNLCLTGAIVEPDPDDDDDFTAAEQIIAFVRSANPYLRKRGVLKMDATTLYYVMLAVEKMTKQHSLITMDLLLQYLRSKTLCPNLQIVTDDCMGTGGQLIYDIPGNMELGMRTKSDTQFIQVRTPFKDPNYVQFWSQFELGSRFRSTHAKMFQTNDQINVAIELSGDYRDAPAS